MTRAFLLLRDFARRPIVRGSRLTTVDATLIGWFTLLTTGMIIRPIVVGLKDPLGIDAVIYTAAARALMAGENPWRVEVFDIGFAAPPPSLIPYIPLTVLPDSAVAVIGIAVAFLSAVYAIRKLGLPMWWLLFPPTALGIAAASSTLPMLALLVRAGVVADAAAVVTRVYAAVPLLVTGRWRGILVGALAIAVTAPFLAWPTYLAEREHVAQVLTSQSNGGGSATAVPLLVPFAILFLILLGRRRAAWLIVPALWPDAQLHYASIAMPILAEVPLIAMALSLPWAPWLVVGGLGGQVAIERLARRAQPAGSEPPGWAAPD